MGRQDGSEVKDDPQGLAVYTWEEGFADWNRQTLSIRQVRDYIVVACRTYGLDSPPVKLHAGRALAYSWSDGSGISFPRWLCNPAIALHEASHFIADKLFPQAQTHGRLWLGVYMGLLVKARVAPYAALRASAREYGLRWRQITPELVAGKVSARRLGGE